MAAAMPQSLWLSEKANTLEARLSLALLVERTGKPEAFRTDCGIAALIQSHTNQLAAPISLISQLERHPSDSGAGQALHTAQPSYQTLPLHAGNQSRQRHLL